MTQNRVRTSAPAHWHIFREVAPGVKQYMLPIYRRQAQAIAAVAALTQNPQRQYHVEVCPHTSCHLLRRPGSHGELVSDSAA
jgi:hypothetical protein